MSTSSTAQYGARPGGVGVGLAGTVVGAALAVGDGEAVLASDGLGVGVGVALGLAGAVIAGNGVDVEDTGGAAHANANAATAMRSGAETARRVLMFADRDATR